MIYLFHGSDVAKTRSKAFEWIEKARVKEPNLVYVRLSREELNVSTLLDAALSNSLFAKRTLTLIDDPFPTVRDTVSPPSDDALTVSESSKSSVLDDYIDMIADSDNAIVILAPKLLAAKAKKIIAKAKFEYKYDKSVAHSTERGFNSNLVNALGARSRERLWLEINRALYAGDAPEMLHGLLHWKARDLRDRKLSMDLITLLQTSRRGGLDLSLSLEKFALSV